MANYIDKAEMLEEILTYRQQCEQAKLEGREKPTITNSLAKKFMDIVNGIARRPNFHNYSFLDDMKSRAIENCFRKANHFDPTKSNNPFGYYSRVIWREFLNVIEEEEWQSYLKAKAFYNHEASFSAMSQDDDVDLTVEGFSVPYFDVDDFEQRKGILDKKLKKEKKKRNKIDGPLSFLDQEDEETACKEFDTAEKFEVAE